MNWLKEHWLTLLVAVGIGGGFVATLDGISDAEREATKQAVADCSREQPRRAYFQLRAQEIKQGPSESASDVFAILNCEETIDRDGRPIPVEASVEEAYLAAYEGGQILILDGNKIIGQQPFAEYFPRQEP